MKKFILSLGVIAAISAAFVFTSCKDDKEPEQEIKVTNTEALQAVAAQKGGTVQGETVVVKNADGTTTTYSYTYTVGGQTYTSTAALQEALAGMTGQVTVTTTLVANTNGTTTTVHSAISTITITDEGSVASMKFPTTTDKVVEEKVVINDGHSGGRA